MERNKQAFGLFIAAAMPTMGVRDEIASHSLISPVKKASRVETRASHQRGAQGSLL